MRGLLDTDQARQLGLGGFLEIHKPSDYGIGAGQDAVLRGTLGQLRRVREIHSLPSGKVAAGRRRILFLL